LRPILFTIILITLASLVAVTVFWRPAGFAFVLVLPLALLAASQVSQGISARMVFIFTSLVMVVGLVGLSAFWPPFGLGLLVVGPLVILGLVDMFQPKRAVLRNYPVIGHARYLFEGIRPEINQYFIESNTEGTPFNREQRSVVYQRAKGVKDTVPFGTQQDLYRVGYEWLNHSLAPLELPHDPVRVIIGAQTCAKPYAAALLNISAMSFGSLSRNAIQALNRGAKTGGFCHNTGEGSISPYHLEGGDLTWQIGTGYFGCRTAEGGFDPALFEENARRPEVKMIEIKLSQGAKPGHGGILPAVKITPEIAAIRRVPLGQDVLSPPAHSAFSGPQGLLDFVTTLRALSGGKPVGFKLCVGKRREFLAICKAMVASGLHPDFITVDGGEGGTGAAPLEFSNSLGCPLTEALVFVHNALVGIGMRDRIKLIASGKIITGFDVVRAIALGADLCNSARGMMMALGCIQARKCHENECPVGVATQKASLVVGLVPSDKAARVARFQAQTVFAAMELIGASGLPGPEGLRPWHILRRTSPTEIHHYGELYHYVKSGDLLGEEVPTQFARAWQAARADSFHCVGACGG